MQKVTKKDVPNDVINCDEGPTPEVKTYLERCILITKKGICNLLSRNVMNIRAPFPLKQLN